MPSSDSSSTLRASGHLLLQEFYRCLRHQKRCTILHALDLDKFHGDVVFPHAAWAEVKKMVSALTAHNTEN